MGGKERGQGTPQTPCRGRRPLHFPAGWVVLLIEGALRRPTTSYFLTTSSQYKSTGAGPIHGCWRSCIMGTIRRGMTEARQESAYRQAGVDIDAGSRAVEGMKEAVRSTFGPRVLADVGLFGGLYALDDRAD